MEALPTLLAGGPECVAGDGPRRRSAMAAVLAAFSILGCGLLGPAAPKPHMGAPAAVPAVVTDLRGALLAHDFDRLEERLALLQQRWTRQHAWEADLETAFDALGIPADRFAEHLDAWVEAKHSVPSLTARGFYRAALASRRRGSLPADRTPEGSCAAHRATTALARVDLEEALRADPAFVPAYWGLVDMEIAPDERRRFFEQALALDPGSLVLRLRYLSRLGPAQGGSFEQVAAVVEESQRHLAENPKLRALLGYRHYLEADAALRDQRNEEGERLAAKAIESGELGIYHRQRAWAYSQLRRALPTIQDCDRAQELMPVDMGVYVLRSRAYLDQGLSRRSLEDLDVALQIDPSHAMLRSARSFVRHWLDDEAGAFADAELATIDDPTLQFAWERAGHALIRLGRPAESIRYLDEGLGVASEEERPYLLYLRGTARYAMREEAAIADLEAFVKACGPRPSQKLSDGHAWASKVLAADPAKRWTFGGSNPEAARTP